jgi:hypothetical protein
MFIKTTYKYLQRKRKKRKREERNTAHVGTNVRARVFYAGLLSRTKFTSGWSSFRPTYSRFSVGFLDFRANAELVPLQMPD